MVDRVFHEVLEWIYAIVIALAIAIVVHTFLIQPTRVSGESMVPTLHNGEYLLISKISHDFNEVPNYGDIVIIDSRVEYPRTWKDDISEPLVTYLAFLIQSIRRKMSGSNALLDDPVIRWLFMMERYGATERLSMNRILMNLWNIVARRNHDS